MVVNIGMSKCNEVDLGKRDIFGFNPSLPVFMDTETIGLYGRTRLIQLGQGEVRHIIDCYQENIEDIKHILKNYHLVLHNAHYDFSCEDFRRFIPKKIDDTMALARIAWPQLDSFSLDSLSKELKIGIKGKEGDSDWSQLNLTKEQLEYAENDIFLVEEIYKRIPKEVFDNSSYKLDMLSLRLALEYQNRGIPVNRKRVMTSIRELKKEIKDADKVLPEDLNVNSSQQVCKLLNTESSASDVLEAMSSTNKFAEQVLIKRKALKSLQYMEEIKELSHMYSIISPFGATTGRFISKGCDTMKGYYNVQQIPNKHKKVFNSNGYFVCADYPALEIWVTGAMYEDAFLYECLKNQKDLHKATASAMGNKPESEVLKDERTIAKKCNFTLLYGAGVRALEEGFLKEPGLNESYKRFIVENVKTIYDNWHKTYSGLTRLQQMTFREFDNIEYKIVYSALGRPMKAKKPTDALNYPIQSTGAECTKLAIKLLANKGIKIVNTVHDSIALVANTLKQAEEFKEALANDMFEAYRRVVKNCPRNDLVFKVDAVISDSLKGDPLND